MVINGVDVVFPYRPYDIQYKYMEKVIESCIKNQPAILESPTGTGKTLSMLCALFSWAKSTGFQNKVIYSSRTHSQLSSVIKELKKTVFRPKIAIVASRSHLCLIDGVKTAKQSNQSRQCRLMRMSKMCPYDNEDRIVSFLKEYQFDFESCDDFSRLCCNKLVCPYLCSQHTLRSAELILTPYVYLIDKSSRNTIPPSCIENSVLVFDEAHNLPDQLADQASVSITNSEFSTLISFLSRYDHKNIDHDVLQPQIVSYLIMFCRQIISIFNSIQFHKQLYVQKDISCVLGVFSSIGIDRINGNHIIMFLSQFSDLMLTENESEAVNHIEKLFRMFFSNSIEYIQNNFVLCFTINRMMNIYCFETSNTLNEIRSYNPKTMIFTSGTLSPLSSYRNSLGIDFSIVLENDHIAKSDQLFLAIASFDSLNHRFCFTYNNRNNLELTESIVNSVMWVIETTPGGSLVFFPSFTSMKYHEDKFGGAKKPIFIESQNKTDSFSAVEQFSACAETGAGLFAVCRGNLSEGLNFSDHLSRTVCIIGIPFPNIQDPKIDLRRKWYDKQSVGLGNVWYTENTLRVVNQSIGRAIRHKDDYAAVILFDERYQGFPQFLPKWMRNSVSTSHSWDDIQIQIQQFFAKMQNKPTIPTSIPNKPDTPKSLSKLIKQLSTNEQTQVYKCLKEFKKHQNIEKLSISLNVIANETITNGVFSLMKRTRP